MELEIIKDTRNNLPKLFKQMGFTIGAEVGVYKGEYCEKFCKEGLKMFAIDPWYSYDGAGRAAKVQKRQEFLYEHTSRVLAPYNDCTIIRKASMDAVKHFKDGSLDFVYIDGDHNFKHVAQDIYEWTWKVRKGGIVAGHDYFTTNSWAKNTICQVGKVVDAYVDVFNIKDFYVFGKKDRCASWLFVR